MPSRRVRLLIATVIAGAAMILAAGGVSAQRFFREGGFAARYAPAQMPDSSFVICRLAYTQVRREQSGIGWETDYPYAEINLSTRFSELTRTRISRDTDGSPNYYVVRATDDTLFNCPVIVASDAGTLGFTEAQADRLRAVLPQGRLPLGRRLLGDGGMGELGVPDRPCAAARRVPIEDIPLDDPILKSQFELHEIPQITNIQFWRQWGGTNTSERGDDSAVVHFRAIRDSHRRIVVLMTHNTDVADSWEREGEDPDFFYQFSPRGYALGVDVLLHVLTH